jgi:hypothetical protein
MLRSIIALTALLLVPWPAQGQSVEVSGGIAFILTQPTLTYETRYVPPANFAEFTGQAGQTLTLERRRRPALWGSVGWFPAPRAGLEVRVRYRSLNVEGTSSPHRVAYTYTSRQPPDYVPRQYSFEHADPSPDPEGNLRELSFDLLGVGRFGDPRKVQMRVSGGLALLAVSGTVRPVSLTSFRLGGHAVLFSDRQELTLAIDRTWTVGAVGGVEIHHAFTPRAGFVAAGRVLVPGALDAPVRVTAVSQGLFTLTPAEAQQALRPAPFRWRPWTLDALVGIRLSL